MNITNNMDAALLFIIFKCFGFILLRHVLPATVHCKNTSLKTYYLSTWSTTPSLIDTCTIDLEV